MRRKGRLIVFILLLILALAGASYSLYFSRKTNSIRYRTTRVERGEVKTAISATGTLNPVSMVLVGSQVSGRILHLYADFNSRVKREQMVAQIDPDLFEIQVTQAQANLTSAQANLEMAEVKVKDTDRTLTRKKELLSDRLIAQTDYESAETAHDLALAQLDLSRAQLSQVQASLDTAQTNLTHTAITSPVDGVVISRHVDIGQTVAASFQTPILFTIAEDLSQMQLNASVDEADIGQAKPGQEVTFTVDAYPQETFTGTLSQVRNAPNILQNVVTYDVIIKVSNPQLKLKPGMTANVSILVDQHQGVLKVPNTALRFRPPSFSISSTSNDHRQPDKASSGPTLWILGPEGRPQLLEVKTGISDGTFTELEGGPLKEGQEVIVETLESADKQSSQEGKRSRTHFPYGRPF